MITCQAVRLATAILVATTAAASGAASAQATSPQSADAVVGVGVDRGRYLVRIMGCNDCHTRGYAESGGKVPEAQWLTGDSLGYNGPWGTTYATNLRLYFSRLSEQQWVQAGRSLATRPPMPWFSVRAMRDDDLRSMYRYVRGLGPAGQPAPPYLPPDQTSQGPAIRWPHPPQSAGSAAVR
jgi:mono/diheme cytochrome c family protein